MHPPTKRTMFGWRQCERHSASVRNIVANSRVSRDTSICLTATGCPKSVAPLTIDEEPCPIRRPRRSVEASTMMKRGTVPPPDGPPRVVSSGTRCGGVAAAPAAASPMRHAVKPQRDQ